MRGLFTAGVLDALMERGVKFDGLVGVSAGACFGCNYKSEQIGRVIRYNKRFARDPRQKSLCKYRASAMIRMSCSVSMTSVVEPALELAEVVD